MRARKIASANVLQAIFGERQYTVEDPWGNRWTFSQSIADVDPAAWGAREPT